MRLFNYLRVHKNKFIGKFICIIRKFIVISIYVKIKRVSDFDFLEDDFGNPENQDKIKVPKHNVFKNKSRSGNRRVKINKDNKVKKNQHIERLKRLRKYIGPFHA